MLYINLSVRVFTLTFVDVQTGCCHEIKIQRLGTTVVVLMSILNHPKNFRVHLCLVFKSANQYHFHPFLFSYAYPVVVLVGGMILRHRGARNLFWYMEEHAT